MKPKSRRQCSLLIKTYLIFLVFFGLSTSALIAQQNIGNYEDISMGTSQMSTVTPSSVPLGAVTVTSDDFPGNLSVNPTSGVVTVTSTEVTGVFDIQVRVYSIENPLNYVYDNFRVVVYESATTPSYSNTAINLGDNATITPTVQPQFISQSAAVSADFLGDLNVDSSTGNITVTNAKPAGVFTITYWGIQPNGVSVTSTFQLTVSETNECSTNFFEKTREPLADFAREYTTVGDFNNDNIQDIITIVYTDLGFRVLPLLGDGLGNFTATNDTEQPAFDSSAVALIRFNNISAVLSHDFNRDGNLDVAIGTGGSILIGYGDGNGNIIGDPNGSIPVSQRINVTDGSITDMAIGHFNNDGFNDIVVGTWDILSNSGLVRVYYGNVDGTITRSNTALDTGSSNPKELHSGNFNTDELSEFFVINADGSNGAFRVNSAGAYVPIITINSSGIQTIITDDLDENGVFDAAVVTDSGVDIYLNNNFNQPSQSLALETAYNDVQTLYFNDDGFLDLLLSSTQDDKITVLLSDGTGGFTEDISVALQDPKSVIVGEFNGDDKQDFVVNNEGNSVFLAGDDSLEIISTGSTNTELGSEDLIYVQIQNTGENELVIEETSIFIDGPDSNLFTVIGHSEVADVTTDPTRFNAAFPLIIGASQPAQYLVVLFEPEEEGTFSATLNVNKGDCANSITSTELLPTTSSTFTGIIGSYGDVEITSGGNIEILATGGVIGFDRLIATTDQDFDGIIGVKPSDGTLTIINAITPGDYTITVKGYIQSENIVFTTNFSPFPSDWEIKTEIELFSTPQWETTFVLTVEDPLCSPGEFENNLFNVQDSNADISNLTALAIGDFNNNGEQDLITTFSNNSITLNEDILNELEDLTDDAQNSSFISYGDGAGGFNYINSYLVGFDPTSIQVDDYNGDGIHDIIAANYDFVSNVFTRIGLGVGNFEIPFKSPPYDDQNIGIHNGNIITPSIGTSYFSKDIAFGDFNNDGFKDFAIVSEGQSLVAGVWTPSFVSIQVGDGLAGTGLPTASHFKENVYLPGDIGVPVGNQSLAIVVSDFNNDGFQDFATASADENKISVRLGSLADVFNANNFEIEKKSFFAPASDIALGEYPSALAKGDFNGDGIIDLAVTVRGPINGSDEFLSQGSVYIKLGNGAAGFSGNVQVPVGISPSSLKIGDFNGDGKQDFAVTNTNSNDVSIRFGNGDGTFYGDMQIPVGESPKKLVLGDFNQDGIQDLAVANQDNISILRGKPLSVQEFIVKGNTILIENNDTTPNLEDNTDFGNVVFNGNSITNSFSIENNGESALTLEDGAISIDGVDSELFSLSNISYPIFIASGESYNFDVNFEPTFEGEKIASVTVTDINCLETISYNFAIKATVVPPPVLGNYPNTELTLGANSVILADAAPINTLRAVAFTDSSFSGELLVNPVSGEVSVINASQSGVFQVTVTAFTIDDFSASTTFSLTVSNPENCVSELPFSTNTEFTQTGANPSSIAIGDFNMDDIQDVIVANEESPFISLKFGNGSDGFVSETTIPVALNTTNVDVADFNGDGHLDIAAININDNDLYTILGNGDGTFQSSIISSVALSPSALAIGDFNNDGNSDIAVTSIVNSSVSILLGNGVGNFIALPEVLVGSLPRHITLLNFNEDAFLDIAVANFGDNTVSIRLGNGDGSFSGTTDIPVGQGPNHLTLGDFNQDGNRDVATANITSNTLSIVLGDGLGSNISVTEINTTDSPEIIKVGEFNGDGIQDLVTSSNLLTTDNLLKVYSGNGSGGFTETISRNLCCELSSFEIGNFNNDGFADVVFTTQTNSKVELLFGAGAIISVTGNSNDIEDGETIPSLTNSTDFGRVQTGESIIKTFTIENTGNSNLVIPEDAILTTGNDSDMFSVVNTVLPVTILPNESFDFEIQFSPVTEGIKETTLHIINNDCNTSDYSFNIEGEGASFSLPNYPTAISVQSGNTISIMPEANDASVNVVSAIAYVDYNGVDNVPNFEGSFIVDSDGVVSVINAKPEGVYTVKIIGLQNLETTAQVTRTLTLTVDAPLCSDGAFRNIQNELNGGFGIVATEGDFNEDGILDIVTILNSNFSEAVNGVNITLGNADGTFQNPQFVVVGSIGLRGISVSDFNGDGHQDLLTRAQGRMYVSLGVGDGSFNASLDFSINNSFDSYGVGDFNNDGKQDIVSRYSSSLICLIGNGDGTFTEVTSSHSFSNPKEIKVGDFNKDGHLDFIALEEFGGIQFHRGQGNGLFVHNSANDIEIDGLATFYTMGDFNNDAIPDIAVSSRDYIQEAEIGSFKIYFGDENANYNPGPVIPIEYDEIRSLHVGDFNGDSNQDILVNNEYVLFGAGDGTFPVIPTIEASGALRDFQVVIGDFNKDGKQDYVQVKNDFEVLLGTGRVDIFSATAAEGDVYLNDGETVASEQSNTVFESCLNTTVSKTYTIENKSSSILTINSINLTGDSTGSFVLGDLDGFPTTVGPNGSTTFVINFLPSTTDIITATLHIENDDCNDQDFDFVIEGQGIAPQSESSVGTYSTVNMVSGENILVQPNSIATGTALSTVAYTDSSFKGILSINPISGDVLITNAYPAGTYQITIEALGVCTSATTTFQLVVDDPACSTATFENIPVFEYETNEYNKETYVADFNEDGIQDIVFTGSIGNMSMRIQLGNGDGTFNLHNQIDFEGPRANSAYQALAIGDFNGDGHQDITATSNKRLAMYLGDGTGDFMLGDVIVVDNLVSQIAIADDFNNDGKLDVLVKEENETTAEVKLAIFLGNGAGGFPSKQNLLFNARYVSVGDFNHDGNKDLIIASIEDSKVYVMQGDGLANFTETLAIAIEYPQALALGDFNNDGEQDIALGTHDRIPNPDIESPITTITTNKRVLIFNGSSNGTFLTAPTTVTQLDDDPDNILDSIWKLVIGDFNADGNQDMALSQFFSTNSLPLLLGNGIGNFTVLNNSVVPGFIGSLAVGDFNSDARQDIVFNSFFGSNSTNILFASGSNIAVTGNSNSIDSGSTMPEILNDTDFGITCPTGTITKTFTIENNGFSDLVLDTDAITVSGGDTEQFAIGDIELPITIAASESAIFTVTFTPEAIGDATTTINIATNDCSLSSYSFAIIAAAGNEESIPPVIECPVIESVYYANSNSCYATIPLNATATDNCTIEPTLTSNTPLNNQFPIGDTTVVYTATDDNGNTATCEFVITVVDNTAPAITCMEPMSVPYGDSIDPADIGSPEVTDNCLLEDVTLTYTDSSNQGTDGCSIYNYTINRFWTATDAAGNTDICLQVINVVDEAGPTVITQDITVVLDESGNATITPEDIDNGSNSNCGEVTLTLDITTFDSNDIGENTVELTVTDANGNVSVAIAIVTVVDESLSIDENTLDLGLSVYPNPTQGLLNLKLANFNSSKISYQLFNLQGQLLLSSVISNDLTRIEMYNLSEGIYLLNVNVNDKPIKSFRIIKKQ